MSKTTYGNNHNFAKEGLKIITKLTAK